MWKVESGKWKVARFRISHNHSRLSVICSDKDYMIIICEYFVSSYHSFFVLFYNCESK